jgi:hypothetical protein
VGTRSATASHSSPTAGRPANRELLTPMWGDVARIQLTSAGQTSILHAGYPTWKPRSRST